jgi:hypothetical protein
MTRYSDEVKYSVVRIMAPPQCQSVNVVSSETGLPYYTLYK